MLFRHQCPSTSPKTKAAPETVQVGRNSRDVFSDVASSAVSHSAPRSHFFWHLPSRPFIPRARGSNAEMVGGRKVRGIFSMDDETSLSTREMHGESSIPSEVDFSPDYRRQNSRLWQGFSLLTLANLSCLRKSEQPPVSEAPYSPGVNGLWVTRAPRTLPSGRFCVVSSVLVPSPTRQAVPPRSRQLGGPRSSRTGLRNRTQSSACCMQQLAFQK